MEDTYLLSRRPWRVIAAEVARETNSTRFMELVEELNQAVAEQGSGKRASEKDSPTALSNAA